MVRNPASSTKLSGSVGPACQGNRESLPQQWHHPKRFFIKSRPPEQQNCIRMFCLNLKILFHQGVSTTCFATGYLGSVFLWKMTKIGFLTENGYNLFLKRMHLWVKGASCMISYFPHAGSAVSICGVVGMRSAGYSMYFFESAKVASPLSVSGCFSNPTMALNGQVAMGTHLDTLYNMLGVADGSRQHLGVEAVNGYISTILRTRSIPSLEISSNRLQRRYIGCSGFGGQQNLTGENTSVQLVRMPLPYR